MKYMILSLTTPLILFAIFGKIQADEACNCTIDYSMITSEGNERVFADSQNFDEESNGTVKLNFQSGKFEGLELIRAWCVDIREEIGSREFFFDLFSSLDDPSNFDSDAVDLPEYFPSLNWLLNEHPPGSQIDVPSGCATNHTITDEEYQLANWNVIDENHDPNESWVGKTLENQCVVDYLFIEARNNIDYEINCNDLSKNVSLILVENTGSTNGTSVTSKQVLVAEISAQHVCSCTGDCDGSPTIQTFPPTNSLSPSTYPILSQSSTVFSNEAPSGSSSSSVVPSDSAAPTAVAPIMENPTTYESGGSKKMASIKIEKTVRLGPRERNICNPGVDFIEGSENSIITYSFILTNTGETCLDSVLLVDENLVYTNLFSGIFHIGEEHRRCFQTIIENDQINAEAHVYGNPVDCLVGNNLLGYDDVESIDSATVKMTSDGNTSDQGECDTGQEVTELDNGNYIITRTERCLLCDCPNASD